MGAHPTFFIHIQSPLPDHVHLIIPPKKKELILKEHAVIMLYFDRQCD